MNSYKYFWFLFLLSVTVGFIQAPHSAIAQEENPSPIRFQHYTTADGLPDNQINDIHQDQQGFLWFATQEGIARFDGYKFVIYDQVRGPNSASLQGAQVQDIYEESSGTLWFATQTNGIVKLNSRTNQLATYRGGGPAGRMFSAIGADSSGTAVFGSLGLGLFSYDETADNLTLYKDTPNIEYLVDEFAVDTAGGLWLSTPFRQIRLIDDTYVTYEDAPEQVTDLWQDNEGIVWFASEDGLYHYDVSTDDFVLTPNSPEGIRAITQDPDGLFWVGTTAGLFTYNADQERWSLFAQQQPAVGDGLPEGNILTITIDDGRNIWLGTDNGAILINPRQTQFTKHQIDAPQNSDGSTQRITAATGKNGTVWAGLRDQLVRWESGTTSYFPLPTADEEITALYAAKDDRIWVGTANHTLFVFEPHTGQFTKTLLPVDKNRPGPSTRQYSALSITEDNEGNMWVIVSWDGLYRVDSQTYTTQFWPDNGGPPDPPENAVAPPAPDGNGERVAGPPEQEIPSRGPGLLEASDEYPVALGSHLLFTPSGYLWLGYQSPKFLSRFDLESEKFDHTLLGENITLDYTEDMHLTKDGIVWFGARSGLISYDSEQNIWQSYSTTDGLASNHIYSVISDNEGDVWVSTQAGISRIKPDSGQIENYGFRSNLPVGSFIPSSAFALEDGRLYFGYRYGIVSFDPQEIIANSHPPKIALVEMRLDNEPTEIRLDTVLEQAIEQTESITLAHDDDFVSFEFTALAFAAPGENLYRYKLEGLEDEWNLVTAERRYATYTDLDAGTYLLRVQGSNEDGIWSTEESTLTIIVEPPWWEAWWFRLIVTLTFIGLIWAVFRLRLYTLQRQKSELEAEVARQTAVIQEAEAQNKRLAVLEERQRIGRELHDDIGQIIGYVNVQSHTILNWLHQENIGQAVATTRQLTRVAQDAHTDIRQYILGVRENEASPQLEGFVPTIQHYMKRMKELYGLECDLTLPASWEQATPLPSETETQLLRIIQESLANIRKHAQTDWAKITFSEIGDFVLLTITDNGTGFDLQKPADDTADPVLLDSHFGLTIMKERAESCDGTFEVHSTLGRGTQITVSVPKLLVDEDPETAVKGLRVMLADDHKLYAEGIANILQTRGVQVVATAVNGVEAQKLAAELQPDLILMDVNMPICDGLEATKMIKAQWPDIRIVMLTVSANESQLYDALRFGASGYLLKSTSSQEFFKMLRDAIRGESVLTPEMASKLLTQFSRKVEIAPPEKHAEQTEENSVNPPSDERNKAIADAFITSSPESITTEVVLTFRQQQVLELVAQGLSNIQISSQLFISESTVKRHISNMLSRLQLKSRYELSYYYQAINTKE